MIFLKITLELLYSELHIKQKVLYYHYLYCIGNKIMSVLITSHCVHACLTSCIVHSLCWLQAEIARQELAFNINEEKDLEQVHKFACTS